MRRVSARTGRQPATAATSVVPPPTSTTNPPAPEFRSKPAPAAAATGSSTSSTTHRGRLVPNAATTDRRSTQVAPPGTHTTARRLNGPLSAPEARRKPCSISAVASRSAITPSRSGWMTLMFFGSLSASTSAPPPMAATAPVESSTAIAEGSSSTKPRPSTQMSVLTVPRSIATPPLLSIPGHL